MKRILSIISIVAVITAVMIACNDKPMMNPNGLNSFSADDTAGLAQFQAWKAMNERLDPNVSYHPGGTMPAQQPVAARSKRTSGTMSSASTHTGNSSKKRGWSKAAKYSAIGGGTGIILGAVINKRNRVAGGVVGGIIGGGIGYAIGRSQDKKDGRY